MARGTVKWFADSEGSGLIAADDGGPDLFVGSDDVVADSGVALYEGQPVDST